MTATRTILKILADGKSRGSQELIDITGLSRKTVTNALLSLHRHQMLTSEPVQYQVTPAGVAQSKGGPISKEEQRRKDAERMRQKRAKALAESAALSLRTTVARAIAKRTPLEAVWGAR